MTLPPSPLIPLHQSTLKQLIIRAHFLGNRFDLPELAAIILLKVVPLNSEGVKVYSLYEMLMFGFPYGCNMIRWIHNIFLPNAL